MKDNFRMTASLEARNLTKAYRNGGEELIVLEDVTLRIQAGETCAIIGPRTRGQLDGASLRSLELTLTPDTLTVIDAIFPGPGGTAPEAYAW